ncbi:MAG: TIR domain-containing protein [Clostridium sp.]|nr:TIR domain-containing protein [Clostridium sp.]
MDNYLSKNIINKSVMSGEYDPDNSDEYVKRLIREDKISDSYVVVVLVGNTKNRKHVDWEIYAGLIEIFLPTVKKSPNGGYYYADLPERLADNIKSEYAMFCDWDYAITNFDSIIEKAFLSRISRRHLINNSRPQMKHNKNNE